MKKFIKNLILSGLAVIMLLSFASSVLADNLDVTFTPNPLFNEVNFLPNDDTEGTVEVKNNSDTLQTIITEAINASDNNNLGSQLLITIKDIDGVIYNDQLSDFLSTAGEVSLGTITSGATRTFTYTVVFINTDDNNYQEKTIGFDVCVGFQGGNTHCGDTVVGGENNTGGGGREGGSSGGGGGGPIILTIVNEQTTDISGSPTATAIITWNTNVLSTSQVVYGPTPPAYTLNMNALYFGYPSGTVEDPTKITNHSVLITGLTPGQTYVYRVVSRASPPTISFEHQFTVPLAGSPLAQAPSSNFNNLTGDALLTDTINSFVPSATASSSESGGVDISPERDTPPAEEIATGSNNNLIAAALATGFNNLISVCTLIGLFIFLAFYLIWKFLLRKEYEKRRLLETQIQSKFFEFFGGVILLAIVTVILIKEYCILPIFLITFVISLIAYFFKKLKK